MLDEKTSGVFVDEEIYITLAREFSDGFVEHRFFHALTTLLGSLEDILNLCRPPPLGIAQVQTDCAVFLNIVEGKNKLYSSSVQSNKNIWRVESASLL